VADNDIDRRVRDLERIVANLGDLVLDQQNQIDGLRPDLDRALLTRV
jgi:hypothetical protein